MGASGQSIRTGPWRWLLALVQQMYAVSVAIAIAVVLLWQGSLAWLAVGALLLGLLTFITFLVLTLLARRASARHGRPRHLGP